MTGQTLFDTHAHYDDAAFDADGMRCSRSCRRRVCGMW